MSMPTRSKTSFRVKVSSRGTITLPKELRDRNEIQEGNTLNLIALDNNLLILQDQKSSIYEVIDKLAEEGTSADLSLEEMLSILRKVRAEYATN